LAVRKRLYLKDLFIACKRVCCLSNERKRGLGQTARFPKWNAVISAE
jgi:hypothetical protein